MKRNFTMTAFVILWAAAPIIGGWGSPAQAQTQSGVPSAVTLRSDVQIERIERDAKGIEKTILLAPKDVAVVPGDVVVFTLFVHISSAQPAVGFKASNPMPAAVRFESVTEDWAEMSVDNGVHWGKLADLKVQTKGVAGTPDVERAATPQDVTHVRWVFADAIALGAKRNISYRGAVK